MTSFSKRLSYLAVALTISICLALPSDTAEGVEGSVSSDPMPPTRNAVREMSLAHREELRAKFEASEETLCEGNLPTVCLEEGNADLGETLQEDIDKEASKRIASMSSSAKSAFRAQMEKIKYSKIVATSAVAAFAAPKEEAVQHWEHVEDPRVELGYGLPSLGESQQQDCKSKPKGRCGSPAVMKVSDFATQPRQPTRPPLDLVSHPHRLVVLVLPASTAKTLSLSPLKGQKSYASCRKASEGRRKLG